MVTLAQIILQTELRGTEHFKHACKLNSARTDTISALLNEKDAGKGSLFLFVLDAHTHTLCLACALLLAHCTFHIFYVICGHQEVASRYVGGSRKDLGCMHLHLTACPLLPYTRPNKGHEQSKKR